MSKVNASINVIEKFKKYGNELDHELNLVRGVAYDTITKVQAECESKLNVYNKMVDEAENLVGEAGEKCSKAQKACANIKSQRAKINEMSAEFSKINEIYTTIDKARDMIQKVDYVLQSMLETLEDYKSLYL